MSNLWVRSRNVEGMRFPYSGRFPIFCFPVWVQQSFSRKFKEMCRSGKRDDLCYGRTVKGGWESVLTIFYTRCCDKDSGVVLQLFFFSSVFLFIKECLFFFFMRCIGLELVSENLKLTCVSGCTGDTSCSAGEDNEPLCFHFCNVHMLPPLKGFQAV